MRRRFCTNPFIAIAPGRSLFAGTSSDTNDWRTGVSGRHDDTEQHCHDEDVPDLDQARVCEQRERPWPAPSPAAANAAKYFAAEAGHRACETAVLTHGGMGYAREYHVERYFREIQIAR